MIKYKTTCLAVPLGLLVASSALAEPSANPPAQQVVPVRAPQRSQSLAPELAEPKPPGRVTFQSDPIADGAIIVVSLGSAGVLELINSTGEIRPQQIAPGFHRDQLIWIDRAAVTNKLHPSAGTLSNVGLIIAGAYAVLVPVLSGMREHSVQTGMVDAIMYSETVALTLALTNIVKIAVRRPRPLAYVAADRDPNYSNSSTDSSLSFFSGHASMTGAIGATATYLAFARSPGTWRPWITLTLATTVSTLVSVYRVRAGKHFPTDVLAGTFAGAGIGIIVPHLHRTEDVQQRRVWVGFAPEVQDDQTRGGSLTLSGTF
jgi:membrane-associated phospholipid phosphatase